MSAHDESSGFESTHDENAWSLKPLLRHAERSHRRLPGIRKIPLRALGIIGLIAFLNIIVWIAAAIVLVSQEQPSKKTFDNGILMKDKHFNPFVSQHRLYLLTFD